MDLTELKVYYPEDTKVDIVAKLQHLLQMDTDEEIILNQGEPFGPISIAPNAIDPECSIMVIDEKGESYTFEWTDLSETQKEKVIHDIKGNKIMCRCS